AGVRRRRGDRDGGRGVGAGARHAVKGESGRIYVGTAVSRVEARVHGAVGGQVAVPGRVADGDVAAVLGEVAVPALLQALVAGELPGEIPAGEGVAEIRDDEVSGEPGRPLAAYGVGDLAAGGGVSG